MPRTIMAGLLAAAVVIAAPLPAQAQYNAERDYYLGEIIRVDKEKDQIVIFDYVDGVRRTFTVERGVRDDLKPGMEVMVSTLKGNSGVAKRVKIIVPRSLSI